MNLSSLWTAAKSATAFIPSPWVIVAVGIAVAGASWYSYGEGYSNAETAKNLEITEMVNKANVAQADWNSKLADLEIKSYDQTLQFKNLQVTATVEREKVITEWKTHYVNSSTGKECVFPASAVAALNKLQDARAK